MRAFRGLLLGSLAAVIVAGSAVAQVQPQFVAPPEPAGSSGPGGTSFLNPFPDNDTYRIQVFGESLAEGLLGGLTELLAKEGRLQFVRKHRVLANLIKGDITEEAKSIEAELEREAPHIAIILPNMTQRYPWRENFDRRFPPGSEARKDEIDRRRGVWKSEYGQRIDRLMRSFKRKGVAVYWVSLPVMRNGFMNEDAQVINEMLRERAAINGGKFIDIHPGFADEEANFQAWGPDLEGKSRQMRDGDGVHFTGAGYRKLAHFIDKELKRDLAQARGERNVPLAGSEEEQKRVRPATTVPVAALARPATPALPKPQPAEKAARLGTATEPSSGDIKADNSRITLRTLNLQGREDSITIDILRPSIPQVVFAAVTRRESADRASQVGDSLLTEIPGGQTVVSTVTPFAESANERRKAAAGSAPYQRVLEKGERLPPKPGRSDDMPWPRIETLPQVNKVEREPPRPTVTGPKQAPAPARTNAPRG